jgi:hypothetical protein
MNYGTTQSDFLGLEKVILEKQQDKFWDKTRLLFWREEVDIWSK